MQDENENQINFEKLREEHTNRVLGQYEAKSKSFRKFFIGVVAFALAFFFIILFPYVSIQYENHGIIEKQKSLPDEIRSRQESIAAYQRVNNGIERLREEIEQSPYRLREFILSMHSISDAPQPPWSQSSLTAQQPLSVAQSPVQSAQRPWEQSPQMAQEPLSVAQSNAPFRSPCYELNGEERVNCLVKQKVLNQFKEYENILLQEIVLSIQKLEGKFAASIDSIALKEGVEKLRQAFEKKLADNPRFWRTFEGKEGFSVEIGEDVDQFWSRYDAIVESQSQKLKQEIDNLQTAQQQLFNQQVQLDSLEKEITARLSQIESPLGKLPIGVNESVFFFPILLGIGFLVCTSQFREATQLRRAFHNLYQEKDPSKAILTDRQVSLVAPLWIDPANPEQNKLVQSLILFIPFVIFIAACSLIFYTWSIPTFSGASQLNRWVYAVLYVLSLGVFLFGSWQVFNELRHYSTGSDLKAEK